MHSSWRPLEGHSCNGILPLPHHPANSDTEFSAEWLSRRYVPPSDQQRNMNAPHMEYDFNTRTSYTANTGFFQAYNTENFAPTSPPGGFSNCMDHSDGNWSWENRTFVAPSQLNDSFLDTTRTESNQSHLSSRYSDYSKEPVSSYNVSSDRAFTSEQPRPSGSQTHGHLEGNESGSFSRQHFPDLPCYGQTWSAQPDYKALDVQASTRLLPQDHLRQNFSESQLPIVGLNGGVHSNEITNAESSCNDRGIYLGNSEQLVRPKSDVLSPNELHLRSNSSHTCLADMYSRVEQGHGISNTDAMTLELPPGFEIPKHSSMGKDSPKIGEADPKVDGRGVKGEGSPGLAKVIKGSKLETVASTLGDAKLDGHGIKGEQNPGLAKVNKGSKSETVASMLGDKLWDGNLQLSSTVTASALAFFKSGEKIPVINWAESLAVKGKVRLDAFEKYIQDLPRSRNRGLMVMSLHWKEGFSKDGLQSIKEVGKKYKQGKRVGYAQPASGIDLYICPRSEWIITILAKHGFFKGKVAVDDNQDSWIACAVWRKSVPAKSNTKGLKEKSESEPKKPPSSPANSTTQHVNGLSLVPDQKSGKGLAASEAGESSGESKIPDITAPPEPASSNCASQSGNSSVSLGQPKPVSQADLASLKKTLMHLSQIDASVLRCLGLEELKANLEIVKSINPSPRGTTTAVATPSREEDDLPEYHFAVIPNKPSQLEPIYDRLRAGGYRGTRGTAPRETSSILGPSSSAYLGIDSLALHRQHQDAYEGDSSRKRARDHESQVHAILDKQERIAASCGTTMSSVPSEAMSGTKSKGLFDDEDDDDMPEWCPPGFDLPMRHSLQPQLPVHSLSNSSLGHMPPLSHAPPPVHFPAELRSQEASHHTTVSFKRAPPLPLPPPPPLPPQPPQSAPALRFPADPRINGSSMRVSSEQQPFSSSHHSMTLGETHHLHPSEPMHIPSASPSRSGPFSDMPPSTPPPLPPPIPPLPQPLSPKMHFPDEHEHPTPHDTTMPFDRAPSPPCDYKRNPSSREHGSDYSRPWQDHYDRDGRHDRRDPRDRRDGNRSSRWRGRRR
ncbi:hypothetical protein Drorol1_Dr00011635 [Drosera rotundifolia]